VSTGIFDPTHPRQPCWGVDNGGGHEEEVIHSKREDPSQPHTGFFRAELIDKRSVLGATLFGLGWAAAGICPGPAITPASWNPFVLMFTAPLFAGVTIHVFTPACITPSADWVDTIGPVWDKGMTAGKTG
jgi:uncharacterized membrane protein YedE/YeeE